MNLQESVFEILMHWLKFETRKKTIGRSLKQKMKTKHYMEDFKNNFHRAILRGGWVLPLPKQCRIINWWKPLYYFQILLSYAYRISLFTSCRFSLLLFLFFYETLLLLRYSSTNLTWDKLLLFMARNLNKKEKRAAKENMPKLKIRLRDS